MICKKATCCVGAMALTHQRFNVNVGLAMEIIMTWTSWWILFATCMQDQWRKSPRVLTMRSANDGHIARPTLLRILATGLPIWPRFWQRVVLVWFSFCYLGPKWWGVGDFEHCLACKTSKELSKIVNMFECLLCFDVWLNCPTFWQLDDHLTLIHI